MTLLERLEKNRGTVSSALGKELAVRVLGGDHALLLEAIPLVLHEPDRKAGKSVRAGAAKLVEKVAEKAPGLVAPHLEALAPALAMPEAQTRWMVIHTFGCCARENPVAALKAIPQAEAFLHSDAGVCLTGAAAVYLGDVGALGRREARRVFPILESGFSVASENGVDWILEAFLNMAQHLDAPQMERAAALASTLGSAKKKSTQKRALKVMRRAAQG